MQELITPHDLQLQVMKNLRLIADVLLFYVLLFYLCYFMLHNTHELTLRDVIDCYYIVGY